eukprot:GEMP01028413.1.p1 GENE.GEMP01028413.1~~GEMP01028413.1.p1  ORF type:complete len:307 (+),score=65.12 GEMP01028413.1:58-978(+)
MVRATSLPRSLPDGQLASVVADLEEIQAMQAAPQQPSSIIKESIEVILNQRPEWRQRMAVMTKSAILRQTILQTLAGGARAAGSAVLGETHIWRPHLDVDSVVAERKSLDLTHGARSVIQTEYGDQNWPKVNPKDSCLGKLETKTQCLPFPVEHVRYDPTRTRSKRYSVPRSIRFAPFELSSTPGPGEYHPFLLPKGVAYSVGESVVMGANHVFPFKGLLGEVDATKLAASPKWTFPKMRRCCSEVFTGQALRDVGPCKTDDGCLSPGPTYEHLSTFHPNNAPASKMLASHVPAQKWSTMQRVDAH